MALPLNRTAYEKLIEEDIAWIRKLSGVTGNGCCGMEQNHIISVLRWSVVQLYDKMTYEERNGIGPHS